jgi:YD repeat-containing protein
MPLAEFSHEEAQMRDDQYFYDDQGRLLGKLHSDGYAYDDEGKFAARVTDGSIYDSEYRVVARIPW